MLPFTNCAINTLLKVCKALHMETIIQAEFSAGLSKNQ